MIEFYNVIISSLIIFLLFNGNLIFFKDININVFKKITISIIIILNIFLTFSFFSNGLTILFYFVIFSIFINLFNFVKNIKNFYFLYFLLFNLVIFVQIAVEPILGWDGQAFWYPKAYNYFSGGSFDNLKEFTRADYPHLGSYIWAFFWKYSLLKYEYVGRYIQIFIYLSSLFLIISFNKNNIIRNIIIVYFLFFISFDLNLFRGYQEYLIFSLINIYVVLHYEDKNHFFLFLYTLLIINIIIWVKNECIIYIIPIIILFIFRQKKIFNKKNFYFLVLCWIILVFRLYMSVQLNGVFSFQDNSFTLSNIIRESFNFSTIRTDLFLIIKHSIITYFKYPIWIFLFIFLIFPDKEIKSKKLYKNTLYIFVFSLLINIFIFHIQDSAILEWQLSTALDRLNFMLSGYFIYFIYRNVDKYFSKITN